MKVRIKGNTIRLRLTKSEVQHFAKNGSVEEHIQFGLGEQQKLVYALESYEEPQLGITYVQGRITILVPKKLGSSWATSEDVGMSSQLQLDDTTNLAILVEKDFHCMKARPGEDESDHYLNPEAKKPKK